MNHQLPEFYEDKDKWSTYFIKVEAYFEGNEVTNDAKRRAVLVAALGTKTFRVVCGRVAPQKPNAEVVAALDAHYNPKPNEISESFRFFNRCQKEGESIHEFIVEIRRTA